MAQMNLSVKQTYRQREQTCGCQHQGVGWGGGGGMEWEFGVSRHKLLYTEWINNKVLLYSTGNYIQYPVINHNSKEYITKLLCCLPELTQRCKSTILQFKKRLQDVIAYFITAKMTTSLSLFFFLIKYSIGIQDYHSLYQVSISRSIAVGE